MNGTDYIYDHGYDGSSDVGYNVSAPGTVYEGSTGSEMAYMFYNNLGNLAYYYELNGNDRPDGTWGLQNVSFESGGPGGAGQDTVWMDANCCVYAFIFFSQCNRLSACL